LGAPNFVVWSLKAAIDFAILASCALPRLGISTGITRKPKAKTNPPMKCAFLTDPRSIDFIDFAQSDWLFECHWDSTEPHRQ
jgi:hypothetical protein